MADVEVLYGQVLVRLVACLEAVAHLVREGADKELVASELERYAEEIRGDLHRGHIA